MKPMLATAVELEQIKYPVLASMKLDGIRCIITEDGPKTRSLKNIPNKYIRRMLSHPDLLGMDGELIVGDRTAPDVFNKTTSGVMSVEGRPDFSFVVFDTWHNPELSYIERSETLRARVEDIPYTWLQSLSQKMVRHEVGLITLETQAIQEGYEGIILRSPESRYKYGRSTVREHYLLKRKPLADTEGMIIGTSFLLRNENEATINALGHTERSGMMANKVVDHDRVGAIEVVVLSGPFEHTRVSIGTGFTDQLRQDMATQDLEDRLVGRVVTFTYQLEGSMDKPRFPSFKGFRKD